MRIRFFLKEPRAKEPTLLFAIAHFDGNRVKLSTELRVMPKDWNGKEQRVRRGAPHQAEINDSLRRMVAEIGEAWHAVRLEGATPTSANVRERYLTAQSLGRPTERLSFIAFVREFRQRSERLVSPSTLRIYKTVTNHLVAFEATLAGPLQIEEIDTGTMQKLVEYLQAKHLMQNTIWNIVKNVKVFLGAAAKEGYRVRPEARGFSISDDEPQVIALSEAELRRLQEVDLSNQPRLSRARDLFLLECYLGLRYSDLTQIKPENITGRSLRITATKTGEHLVIPLTPRVLEILARYPEMELPVISNQKFNDYIKLACRLAGISDHTAVVRFRGKERVVRVAPKHELISTHTGRRTFVTLSLERGVRPEVVMKVTGHKDMKSFQRYVEVSNVAVAREIERAWG